MVPRLAFRIITLVNGINKLTIPVGSDITIQTANIGLYRAKYIKANNLSVYNGR